MPRASSISFTASTSRPPFVPPPHSTVPGIPSRQRAMGKATSFADLRLAKDKLLKRFQRGGSAAGRDLDFFGCAGEMDFEEGDEAWQGECTKATLHGPPSTAPPPRRPAPYRFPLSAPLSSEEQRQLERRREEELAAAACLDYISAQSHSTRSSSLADIDTTGVTGLSNAVERTNIQQHPLRPSHPHARVPSRDMLDLDAEGRPRSNSVVSLPLSASDCSSRPRTNDSLPSFAESASTIDTTGSFPPSPVQSPSLRSRPTFASGIAPVKVDTEVIAQQPRAYTFI